MFAKVARTALCTLILLAAFVMLPGCYLRYPGYWSAEFKLRSRSLEEISHVPALDSLARSYGREIFADECWHCHGKSGEGEPKWCPALNTGEWIWGGSLEDLFHTIKYGVRNFSEPHDFRRSWSVIPFPLTRWAVMPRFDQTLSPEQIVRVGSFVRAIREGKESEPEGARLFGEHCSSCHGSHGEGAVQAGVPRLAGPVWVSPRHRDHLEEYISVGGYITTSRDFSVQSPTFGYELSTMPAWGRIYDDVQIKSLAIFVKSLSSDQRPR